MLLLAACGAERADRPAPESTGVPGPTPAARFTTIDVRRVGGLVGVDDQVTVDVKGTWAAMGRAGGKVTGQLTADQLARLVAYASDPRLGGEAARAPTKCRDAFSYVVTVDAVSATYVDCPADGTPAPVASSIVGLLHEAGAL